MPKPRFLQELDTTLAVGRHAILHFNTQDRFLWPEGGIQPSSLNFFLADYFLHQGYRVAQYVPALGLHELPRDTKHELICKLRNEKDQQVVLNGIFALLRQQNEDWIVLVQYGEHLTGHSSNGGVSPEQLRSQEILHQLALDSGIAASRSRVVLISFEGIPAPILGSSPGYESIRVDLPQEQERLSFTKFIEKYRDENHVESFGYMEKDLNIKEFSRITAGMPLIEIEALFKAGGHAKQPVSRSQVRQAKARTIRQMAQELLEVSEPESGFNDVAGMTTLKEFFRDLLIPQIRSGRPAPQAILMHGEPGCGKSHVVKALAHEMDWPLLEMRNIHGPLVGQSEQQLERVISVVEQLAPCILFFDEIDQTMGQRGNGFSGDSGTSERMLARIFSWLGSMHLRGRVLFIGATNRPDLLDPAMMDRFRVSLPILKPGQNEIKELIPLFLDRFERTLEEKTDSNLVAAVLAALNPSGRSLQEMIIQAGLRADAETGHIGSQLSGKHIIAAANDFLAAEDPVELEFIRLNSIALCSAQSLLPWNGLHGLREGSVIPEDLLRSGVVESSGRVNSGNLHQALKRLSEDRRMARFNR